MSTEENIIAWPTGQEDEIRSRIAAHRAADEIVQGQGWTRDPDGTYRGCAVGCALDNYDHHEYARILGLPLEVAYLIDAIHEHLPLDKALDWPQRVVDALRPGTCTRYVWIDFAIWLLTEECLSEQGTKVADLYQRLRRGGSVTDDEWSAAAEMEMAWAELAADAAWAAARSAAAWSAEELELAAELAADAARSAAAAAERAERSAAWARQADKLITLLHGSLRC